LEQQIGTPLYARLAADVKGMVPEAMLSRMRPWLAAVLLSQKAMKASGLDASEGAEKILSAEAQKRRMPIEGLETIADQVRAMTSLEADGATQMLQQTMDEAGDAPKHFAALVAAWKAGDMAQLEAAFLDGMDQYPKAYDALLVQRNKSWMPLLDACLERKKPVFVAVGAAHLVGKDGLVALLKARGYRATLVQPGKPHGRQSQ
jgi:uncharacterized protein